MNRLFDLTVTLLALCLFGTAAEAQTTWTGALSTSWSLAGNWDSGLVPTGATDVIIAPAANQPSSFLVNPVCNDLTIQSGASLALSGGFDLTVNGDLAIGGTLTVSSPTSQIDVAGDWTNDGSFSNGGSTVEFSGAGSVGGSGSTMFSNLVVSGGGRTFAIQVLVSSDVTVESGATLDIGSATHVVSGNWTSSAGGAVSGSGSIEFDGSGLLTTGANTVPNVLVSAGVRAINTSAVAGDLDMTGGQIQILDSVTFSVGGDASLVAGTLGWDSFFGGAEILDVDGSVTLTAAAGNTSSDSILRCAGAWSSTSAFAPSDGTVELDGGTSVNVSGASPTFANLRVVSGTKTITSATSVTGDLTIDSGATLNASAALDVNGSVTLGATAAFGLGSSNHNVAGGWTSSGGSATGTGAVVFDGSGVLSTGGGSISNAVISAGTRSVAESSISGNLSMLGGSLELLDDQTLAVGGDLSLSVGTVSMLSGAPGNETIDVEGDVSITATAGSFSSTSQIRCAGNWSSSAAFTPTDGIVRVDGSGTTTIGGSGTTFPTLNVEGGTRTVVSPVTVEGEFTLFAGATLDSDAAMDFEGNVTVGNATSSWDIGSATHTIAGDFLSLGGSALGTGWLEFDGTGTLTSGGGDVSNARVSGGTRTLQGTGGLFILDVLGDFELTGGSFVVGDDSAMRVGGDASLTSGTLGFLDGSANAEVIDVAGNVVLSATAGTMSANSVIFCAGDWTSDAAWTPSAGIVALDPAVASTVSGTGTTFSSLRVASGTVTVAAAATVLADLSIESGATLDTDAALDVDGDVTLGDNTAAWDVGASTHTIAGGYVSSGASATGAGGLLFDGPGDLNPGGATLPGVELSSGARSAFSGTVDGDLTLSAGTLTIEADQTLAVTGNASLAAGTLAWTTTGGTEALDVEGDVTIAASAGTTSAGSVVRCAGNWSSDAAFAPTAGSVELDGGTTTTVGGTGTTLASLHVVSGTKTVLTAATIAGDLTVDSGATLDADAVLDVDGDVTLGNATASIDVGGLTHTVGGDWTSAGGSAVGTGTVELDGAGVLSTSTGSVPNLRLAGGLREVDDSLVTGDLELTAGELLVRNDQTLTVDGDATLFAAGTLSWHGTPDGTPEVIDVQGAVTATASAGTTTEDSELYVESDWTSSSSFAPTSGTIYLDGASPSLIDGSGITLSSLVIRNSGRGLLNAANVADVLVETGATLQLLADLTVTGDATVEGTLALGPQTISVAGDFTATDPGASVTGTGLVRLTDTGTLSSGANALPTVEVTAGQRAVLDSVVTGVLTLSGGLMRIGDNQTLTVGGDASLSVLATLAFDDTSGGLETLDVDGAVVASATVVDATANSRIHCAGNWTSFSTFAPADGVVVFDGGTPTTIGGPGVTLADVLIDSGTKTLTAAMGAQRLEVASGAALVASASADVDGDVVLGDGSASFDMGALTHLVEGNWLSSGASATNGTVEFDGSGQLDTGGGSIANVTISAGTRSVASSSTVGADLEMTDGTLSIEDDQTLTVGGDASLSGGVLSFVDGGGGPETLDVAGNANVSATAGTTSASSVIAVAGDWTSSSSFAPGAGTVVLDGGTPAQIDGSGVTLADLVIDSGTKTLVAAASIQDLTVQSGATFVTNAALDVDGVATLGDNTASWDLGGGTHTVAGDWTSAGASATNGTVDFDGPGGLVTGGGPIANARVSAGLRSASTSQIDGLLELTGGELSILDDQTLSVGGDALLTGGTLSWEPVAGGLDEELDVEGDVVCSAAVGTASASSVLRCAGDWSSDSTFAPTAGRVVLDGAGTTALAGLAPGFDPTFFQLSMTNGTRRSTSDHVLDVETFTIDMSASYEIDGATVTIPGTSVLVNGTMALGIGAVLELGPTVALLTSATGTLSLVGTPSEPAVITGTSGGGYLLTVDGELAASNYRFEQMGAAGIVVSNGASIGAQPNDLRAGAFAMPSSAGGSVMLDIRRDAATDFRYVSFEDPGDVGTFNVRVLSGATITFTNASGDFAGPSFEQDPFGLVDWTVEETTLASYTATPDADQITLDWSTSLEADVMEFSLQRGTSASGPFAEIAVVPAAGPSAYQHVDTTVTPQIRYYYDLVERKTHGSEGVLGQEDAVAWSATVPPANFLSVGPSGSFATIQAAINAIAVPLPVITVEAGTYAPFTLGAGLGRVRILADGSGPVTIDTTTGSVVIQNLGANDGLEMSDFTIGDPLSPNAGIVVSNCAGVVVLDELVVHGGTGQPGIHVDGSARTAIQRTDADGSPGLLLDNASTAVASNGTLDDYDVIGLSTLRTAQLAGTSFTEAGSTLIQYPDEAADLDVPEFVSIGEPFTANFGGLPGGVYVLVIAGDLGWIELPNPPWEMIGVFNFVGAVTLNTGVLDGSGQASAPLFIPVDGKFYGKPFVLTTVVVKPTPPFRFRWGNVASIIPLD